MCIHVSQGLCKANVMTTKIIPYTKSYACTGVRTRGAGGQLPPPPSHKIGGGGGGQSPSDF